MDKFFKLYTVSETAKLLSVSPSVLYKWKGKKIPYVKIGRSIRFIYSDIMEFINKNRIIHPERSELKLKVNAIKKAILNSQNERQKKICKKIKSSRFLDGDL